MSFTLVEFLFCAMIISYINLYFAIGNEMSVIYSTECMYDVANHSSDYYPREASQIQYLHSSAGQGMNYWKI